MPDILIGEEKIHYQKWREFGKQSLVAIHGSGGNIDHWPEAMGNIPGTDVYALDLPEHGGSKGTCRESVDGYARLISDFIGALGLDRVILMGHSLGGAISQTIALLNPSWLKGIVLVGTGARLRVSRTILDGLALNPHETSKLILKALFGPSVSEDVVKRIREGYRLTPASVTLNDFRACDGFDILSKVQGIQCPTLILSGEADQLTPVKYGAYLNEAIPGSRHVIIPGVGHMMALEAPSVFVSEVSAFLSEMN